VTSSPRCGRRCRVACRPATSDSPPHAARHGTPPPHGECLNSPTNQARRAGRLPLSRSQSEQRWRWPTSSPAVLPSEVPARRPRRRAASPVSVLRPGRCPARAVRTAGRGEGCPSPRQRRRSSFLVPRSSFLVPRSSFLGQHSQEPDGFVGVDSRQIPDLGAHLLRIDRHDSRGVFPNFSEAAATTRTGCTVIGPPAPRTTDESLVRLRRERGARAACVAR